MTSEKPAQGAQRAAVRLKRNWLASATGASRLKFGTGDPRLREVIATSPAWHTLIRLDASRLHQAAHELEPELVRDFRPRWLEEMRGGGAAASMPNALRCGIALARLAERIVPDVVRLLGLAYPVEIVAAEQGFLYGTRAAYHVDELNWQEVFLVTFLHAPADARLCMPWISLDLPIVPGLTVVFDPLQVHAIVRDADCSSLWPFVCFSTGLRLHIADASRLKQCRAAPTCESVMEHRRAEICERTGAVRAKSH